VVEAAFVKAIATSRHASTADLHRYEGQALLAIPSGPALPRVYATYDDGDWVGLLLEDIEGGHPVPGLATTPHGLVGRGVLETAIKWLADPKA
jgi:hypothetical protein